MKNRKEIETDILFLANRFTPSGFGGKIYTSLFKTLTDDQFKAFWNSICDSGFIPMFVENDKPENAINYDDLCKLAKELDIPLEQTLIITDPDTGLEFETPKTAIVGIAETRKQRQLLAKKFGASKHDHEIEDLTGQPTGDSKAGGISNPEIQVLLSLGLKTMAKELADVRGGDMAAYRSYKSDIIQTGTTTTQASLKNGSGVKSLRTAHFLLRAQLLDNNLG